MKTYVAKPAEIKKKWVLIDARDVVLGRLASEIAKILRGKHLPSFTPFVDCGDNVVVINAKHIRLTGKKSNSKDGKFYYRHTGYPGGIKESTAGKILNSKYPERVLRFAVNGMIKSTTLGKAIRKHLYIYAGSDHPHQPQQPVVYDFASRNSKNYKTSK